MGADYLAFSTTQLDAGLVDRTSQVVACAMKTERYLVSGDCWAVTAPKDFSQFLLNVAQLLPPGSVLCIEACCSPRPVLEFLNEHEVEATIKLPRGTLLPRSEMFHLPVTDENLRQLDNVIASSDAGAIPTHVQAYNGDSILLQWFDASARDPIFASKKISENALREFCAKLGCELTSGIPHKR